MGLFTQNQASQRTLLCAALLLDFKSVFNKIVETIPCRHGFIPSFN